MDSMSIKEIERALDHIEDDMDALLKQCTLDPRKGVQQLVQRWHKRYDKKKAEEEQYQYLLTYENRIWAQGFDAIAGIDEVGRGPLAGPVVAAAVVLPREAALQGINDSKKLSEAKREGFFQAIQNQALDIGIGIIHAEEIDEINIYEATKKAMIAALNNLKKLPEYLLIDAMKIAVPIPQESIIKGDASSASIAAASIVAKVTRDRMMREYGEQFPQFGFSNNMGYGTKEHLDALRISGPISIHRKSFAPVKDWRIDR